MSDSPDATAWKVAFHQREDDSRLGDVVAYRIDPPSAAGDVGRLLLLLLAEDTPFDESPDRWRLAVTQALRRESLSDVRADSKALVDDPHEGVATDPERTYRDPDGSETWSRARVTFHRGVRIETRIKTMQAIDGRVTAQDAAISITDGHTPRQFSVPIAVLDQVMTALHIARDDAGAINRELATRGR
ncbi:hypothetical protein L5G28_12600 [Gordonia sp. HY285]|uniref:hypothetical protein n=1 Tax=Gordonia liuliyuniae TaxID=2911517 RepID=UPI001F3DAD89|nr:hypothetical protein [Gordonia liuliyuniae]MCF8610988.1 hypothetical protein [Gordonia liuliyuniae]